MLGTARCPSRTVIVSTQTAVFLTADGAGRLCLTSRRAAAVCGFAVYGRTAGTRTSVPMVVAVRCPRCAPVMPQKSYILGLGRVADGTGVCFHALCRAGRGSCYRAGVPSVVACLGNDYIGYLCRAGVVGEIFIAF